MTVSGSSNLSMAGSVVAISDSYGLETRNEVSVIQNVAVKADSSHVKSVP